MKYGIEISIDVTKIDKARIYEGKKGKYLTMTTFVDVDNKDQYDNNGMVVHKATKEESERKERTPILGNVKVFWSGESSGQSAQQSTHVTNEQEGFDDESIPF